MSEIATFGAGCFWGVEASFRKIPGVLDAVVGYSGGKTENPSYKDVCTDRTGHAEVVRTLNPPESSAMAWLAKLAITPDGEHYAYSLQRMVSQLFVVDGWA